MEADLKRVPVTRRCCCSRTIRRRSARGTSRRLAAVPVTATAKNSKSLSAVIGDVYADGSAWDGPTEIAQRQFATFLKAHRNNVGYFHGHSNSNEFYAWKGPDKDVALPTFRVDSPIKGKGSGKDETRLSFEVVAFDVSQKKLTTRECLWNRTAGAGGKPTGVAWGESTTVSLLPRSGQARSPGGWRSKTDERGGACVYDSNLCGCGVASRDRECGGGCAAAGGRVRGRGRGEARTAHDRAGGRGC